MAGLPKSVRCALVALLVLAGASLTLVSQEVQTPSLVIDPIDDVQTAPSPLQPVIDRIESNPDATPEEKASLIAAFEAADAAGVVTPEQALEMLALVFWDTLTADGNLAAILDLLQATLAGLISGEITGDPLVVLADALDAALTPPGVLNALGKAGADEETLAAVADLVGDGMPPGILVRVVKSALRDGLSPEEIAERLAALETAATEEQGWGQAANEVTGQGEFKHQEQEENENHGKNEEPEDEENRNGSQGSNGKAKGKSK